MNEPARDGSQTITLVQWTERPIPWITLLLVATCVIVSVPLVIDPQRFYMALGTGYCDQDSPVLGWKYLVTPFVHGAGCGFPPLWFHLGLNVSLFLFHGAIVERLLGSGRFALLTFTSLAVHSALKSWVAGGRVHGASGMAFAYVLFVLAVVIWVAKAQRWRVFGRSAVVPVLLLCVLSVLGLLKSWHLFSVLVSVPFFFAWRGSLRASTDAALEGRRIEEEPQRWRIAAIAAAALLLAINSLSVATAMLGRLG